MNDSVCPHLTPFYEYYRQRGYHVVAVQRVPDTNYTIVVLDGFIHKRDITSLLTQAPQLSWEYADPHYGTGNAVTCTKCRVSLEGKFDLGDPQGTLGE